MVNATRTNATWTAEAPCPRLRPTVDAVPVEDGAQRLVCLYDRQDPSAGQLVLSEQGVLLASLLDGRRTVSAVRAAFALRAVPAVGVADVAAFVRRLDDAYLLDSDRFREREQLRAAQFRALPTRAAVHAGGAYPGDPDDLRAFLDARYTMPGGPGAPPNGQKPGSLRALIAPHIDLHRGGHSYAWGYRELAEREPAELYVLLGTCHQPMERPFAATARPYDTPFGPVRADPEFLERLAKRSPFDLFGSELSHRAEHSLEFQAVYLRYLGHSAADRVGDGHDDAGRDGDGRGGEPRGGSTHGGSSHAGDGPGGMGSAAVVPILCVPPAGLRDGRTPGDDAQVADFLGALREAVAEDGRRVCYVAGADFAHVGPQFGDPALVDRRFADHVRRGDLAMLEHVAGGDADAFYRQVTDEQPGPGMAGDSRAVGGPRRICGLAPMYALLSLLGPSEGRVLHYDQWIDPRGTGSVTFGCISFP